MNKQEEKSVKNIINQMKVGKLNRRDAMVKLMNLTEQSKINRNYAYKSIYVIQMKKDKLWEDIVEFHKYSQVVETFYKLKEVTPTEFRIIRIYNRGKLTRRGE